MAEPTDTEILERIKQIRTQKEPEGQPNADDIDVSEEEAPEDEAELLATETEEEEGAIDQADQSEDESEESYVVLKSGKEISLTEIEELMQGGLRQSDYTQKTMKLAEDRKAFEGTQKEKLQLLESHIELLSEMTESEFSDVNWEELRDDDTAEYLRLKERKESRGTKLQKAKEAREQLAQSEMSELIASEKTKLISALPEWKDPDKQKADIDMLSTYLEASGWKEGEFDRVTNHKDVIAYLDAARFHDAKTKKPSNAKKIRKAPLVVKGKQANVTNIDRQLKEAEARLKSTGKMEDAMALRKLKRQLNK